MSNPSARYIAVVGSGPAGFFAAEALLKHPGVEVHLFERLSAPYGLVRYGVAPDHQKIKQVSKGFDRTANDERLKFFGNTCIGSDISATELAAMYDQVVYANGCEAAQMLGVPGEHLAGVHSALAFVSWYNGHPNYTEHAVDLNVNDVVVVGAGDVSMDVSRLLLSSQSDLEHTDMPEYALAEFKKARVRRIHILIRRGPSQIGLAAKELRAVVEIPGVKVRCDVELLNAALTEDLPNAQRMKLEYLREVCQSAPDSASQSASHDDDRELIFHFQQSPVEFIGEAGKLTHVKCERNHLVMEGERVRSVGTGQFAEIPAQLALLAVGYRGVAIGGLPFDERSGLVPNREGRVLGANGEHFARHYVVGWLKRGPQGVIGTNKGDAKATVELMLADLKERAASAPHNTAPPNTEELLRARGVRFITFRDWERLDALEVERGAARGKPREKITSAQAALAALDSAP
jgi:ferredoxin--NADP+ reductase